MVLSRFRALRLRDIDRDMECSTRLAFLDNLQMKILKRLSCWFFSSSKVDYNAPTKAQLSEMFEVQRPLHLKIGTQCAYLRLRDATDESSEWPWSPEAGDKPSEGDAGGCMESTRSIIFSLISATAKQQE